MSVCTYNSKKLIPAPYVSVTKNYQTTGDGTKLSSLYQITIIGKVLADKGSPYKDIGDGKFKFWTSTGYPPDNTVDTNQRLGFLIRKREEIEKLFAVDGKSLEWQSGDGSSPMKCNPRILSIDWTDGPWFNYIDYRITLEADVIYGLEDLGTDDLSTSISEASETWSIEEQEDPLDNLTPLSYRVSHTINATGKRFYDVDGNVVEAYIKARDYVQSKMGFNSSIMSGIISVPSYFKELNHVKTTNHDSLAGNFSATETWLLSSGLAKTEYNIDIKRSQDNPFTDVSINGSIQGFRNSDHPYTNAKNVFRNESGLAYIRAQAALNEIDTGLTLNQLPLAESYGHNPVTGNISYNLEYNTRPTNYFTKARTETISINRDMYANPPAIITVLGRAKGPVLQDLFTRKEYRITLNVELVRHKKDDNTRFLPSDSPANAPPYKTELESLVTSISPTTLLSASKQFIESQTDNFDMTNGRYTYNITWIYEV